jgi:hypothetical protein
MPLVAQGLGGLIDATRADLDLGVSWQSIHRVRPRVTLGCPACGGSMHAKVSPRGLRFFAHDAACRDCPLNGETPDHRLLKSAIAAAVRMAGWHATLEAEGPDRRWRADVLAVSADGSRMVAWEAQLAQQHDDDTRSRTARYADDGVEVVWVFDRLVPGDVPAIAVEVDQDFIQVASPVARLTIARCEPDSCVGYSDLPTRPPCPSHGRWEAATLALETFVGLLCRGDIVWTSLPAVDPTDGGEAADARHIAPAGRRWWTSPAYLRRADAVRQAQSATDAAVAGLRAQLRLLQEQDRQRRLAAVAWRVQQEQRHKTNRAALQERQKQLEPAAVRQVAEEMGTMPWALKEGDFERAMGVSLIVRGQVVAVICPVASRITPDVAARLVDVTVYVASEHEQRAIARRCRAGQRFVVVSDPAP